MGSLLFGTFGSGGPVGGEVPSANAGPSFEDLAELDGNGSVDAFRDTLDDVLDVNALGPRLEAVTRAVLRDLSDDTHRGRLHLPRIEDAHLQG